MQKNRTTSKNDHDDEDSLSMPFLVPEKKAYRAFESEFRSRQLSFYLSGPIEGPEEYTEMIHAIRTAGPNDEIFLYLNTPGGRLDTGIQLINAIRQSQATVYTVLEAQAYSMGALLFLCGNSIIVGDNSLLMFHNYSSGLYGKGNEQMAEIMLTAKWFRRFMHDVCVPFLTPEEVDEVLNGKDIWMESEEILARLQKMQGSRTKDGKKAKTAADSAESVELGAENAEEKVAKKPTRARPRIAPRVAPRAAPASAPEAEPEPKAE